MRAAYAELHCLSHFSFLRGASGPAELVARAAALGYEALAITDECSVAGIVRAHAAAREHSLRLIIGSEIRLQEGARLVVLAADRQGLARALRSAVWVRSPNNGSILSVRRITSSWARSRLRDFTGRRRKRSRCCCLYRVSA